MKKPLVALAILAVLVPSLALPGLATVINQPVIDQSPYKDPRPDWPEMLVFKGVGIKNGEIVSAAFVGMERQNGQFDFRETYVLVGGEAQRVKIENVKNVPERGAVILRFENGDFLLLKAYQQEYRGAVLVVSGVYEGYNLNMRAVGVEDYAVLSMLKPVKQVVEEEVPMNNPLTE
jgi:hypothetical protein